MYPIAKPQRDCHAGFSMLEVLVVLIIIGVLLATGVPAMSHWVLGEKARGAVEFYAEGLAIARQQAMAHNARSRFSLVRNTSNGQYDWQVDLCFPTDTDTCDSDSEGWSTTAAVAAGDQANGFLSVNRSAVALPKAAVMVTTLDPVGNSEIYFNSTGWVDTSFGERLTSIQFSPGTGFADAVRPAAIVVGLAGTATRCDPEVAAPHSRACP